MSASSVVELFLHQADTRGEETAALHKQDGRYQPVTWNKMRNDAREIAAGLIALGLEAGERASILSHTSMNWVLSDLGILMAGGVTVPIYPSNLAHEVQYILEHSDSNVVFAQNTGQVAKCREQKDQLPLLRKVIQIEGDIEDSNEDGWVMSLQELLTLGAKHQSDIDERVAGLNLESMLTIIYTSGTTGKPKGVVITHGAMVTEGDSIAEIDVVRSSDIQLLFLPLAHVFAKVLQISWFASGFVMAFAENMQTIRENMQEVRPTLMCGVPRVFEKFYAAVIEKGNAGSPLSKKLLARALELSSKNGEAEESPDLQLTLRERIEFRILKRLVFRKISEGIMQILGGRMRLMVSGGAPLAKKIAWFFRDAEIVLAEGYGLTETCAGTCVNRPNNRKIGTVGPPVPGMQVQIAEDGEIAFKGRAMLREYWKDPEATAKSLRNGWFYTGDIGEVDPKTGALRITDRKKDIIVTAGGKNVAPQKIENILKTNKLISQAVVYGDRRKYLCAIITLDPDALEALAKELNLAGSYAVWTQSSEVERTVSNLVSAMNANLASYETIKKFRILDHDFSVEGGQLTPKLSVKRKLVNQRYEDIFDSMYSAQDRDAQS